MVGAPGRLLVGYTPYGPNWVTPDFSFVRQHSSIISLHTVVNSKVPWDVFLGDYKSLAAYDTAASQGCDLVVFPELTVTGYPPEDLLLKPAFVAAASETVAKLAARTGECAAVIGFPEQAERHLYNAAAVCARGQVLGVYRKQLLPNYSVFDEQRYFEASHETGPIFEIAGTLVAGPILSPSAEPALTALRDSGHELVLNYEGVSHREISAVRWGQASFALIVEPPLIVLCYRFGEAVPWALAPFRWNEFSAQDRMTVQWDEQEFLAQANLKVSLVEAADGRVLANRVAPLSRSLSRAWVAAIRRQSIQTCFNPGGQGSARCHTCCSDDRS